MSDLHQPNLGLRELTPAELELVAGGTMTITVTGIRVWGGGDESVVLGGSDDGSWNVDPGQVWGHFGDFDDHYGNGDQGGDPPPDPLVDSIDKALDIIESKHAILADLVQRYGPNQVVKFPDGSTAKLGDLLEGTGKLITAIDAGLTVGQIITGDAKVHDAIFFAFGVTVGAMAASAGTSAVVAAALGMTAEYAASNMVDWIKAMGEVNAEMKAYFNEKVTQFVENNTSTPPNYYQNPIEIFRGMFGFRPYLENEQ